jgi:hypothetical protein
VGEGNVWGMEKEAEEPCLNVLARGDGWDGKCLERSINLVGLVTKIT